MDLKELERWFGERHWWLQDAARRIVQNGDLTDKDYAELADICMGEVLGQSTAFIPLPPGALSVQDTTKPFRLESISDVQGINALSPTKPLEFGREQLCVVYGRNGTGKSGYVRLLKHACGARHPGVLEADIFTSTNPPQSATFVLADSTATGKNEWTGAPIPQLQGVDVYDTACGVVYVNGENEVTFEPWLLRLFTRLNDSCVSLSSHIKGRIDGLVSKKPDLPAAHLTTKAGAWYIGLSACTSAKSVDDETAWTPVQEAELERLNKRLAEPNPSVKAAALRRLKESALKLKDELQICREHLLKEPCEAYVDAKADALAKRKAADEDAKKIFENSPLGKIGSKSWRLLWDAARRYSEEVYVRTPFPNVSENARCLLCQRPLDKESKERFVSFEQFVKGELQRMATEAEQKVQETEVLFPDLPTADELITKMNAAGIENPDTRTALNDFVATLRERKQTCLAAGKKDEIPSTPPSPEVLASLSDFAAKIEKEALQCDEDAKGQNRPDLERDAKELAARKWLNQQRKAIDEEIARLGAVAVLKEMDRQTDTHALSTKKGNLAEELITAAYAHRFSEELKQFGGSRIKVELVRTRTAGGHVYHRILLRNAKRNAKMSDILSEGEFRIVSLAAFLADAEGRGARTPFVFDDPISSLDHEYEEATARRLVRLVANRQVIVFTHRLSLLGFLDKYAEKAHLKPHIVCLNDYRIGEIADLPINLKKTESAVNGLLNGHLKRVQKAFNEGAEAYEKEAGAICRNIRILLERVVEKELVNEVIRRFNPEVQTKNKIQALAKVTMEDCNFIDGLMTKYSSFEHSQPEETPIKLPQPDEIEQDLNAIAEFIKKLKERNK